MHEHEADFPDAATDAAEHDRRLRDVCERLALFRLCRRMRCRRAGACRGFPRECVPRFLPLVPENARALPVAFALAREAGLPFEQALARCEPELAAFAQWHAAIRGRGKVYLESSAAYPAGSSGRARPQ